MARGRRAPRPQAQAVRPKPKAKARVDTQADTQTATEQQQQQPVEQAQEEQVAQTQITGTQSLQLVRSLLQVVRAVWALRAQLGAELQRSAASLLQSLHEICFYRGLFPGSSFKSAKLTNLEGALGSSAWYQLAAGPDRVLAQA